MNRKNPFVVVVFFFVLGGCATAEDKEPSAAPAVTSENDGGETAVEPAKEDAGEVQEPGRDPQFAHVVDVRVTGTDCSVTVQSPDEGCDRYANWWEVLRPDGSLVYRRILGHSHVEEQPFTRSGGPVVVDPDEELLIRAHMHPVGYGGDVLRGSVNGGFVVDRSLGATFAPELAGVAPLPTNCAF